MPQNHIQPDVVIVGAGIVGLATAYALRARDPGLRIRVLERSAQSASGQSGHNSGVIHSGIYYAPGSLKARLCREGRARLLEFCRESGVAHRICGKLLVATDAAESQRLRTLYERGQENGLQDLSWLESNEIATVEPEITGLCALSVPEAGVVDFASVCKALQARLESAGVEFCFSDPLLAARVSGDGVQVRSASGSCSSGRLIACAGLYADEVARRSGLPIRARIVSFRGEYRVLADSAARRVRALVYPVPDPALPFLGVHLTRDIHGTVDAGPNAVLALAREGYTRGDIDLGHLFRLAAWPGAWRLAWRQRHYVGGEMIQSLSKRQTARALRKMLPALLDEELLPGGSGVRAQLVDPDGRLVDDFRFVGESSMLHVLNAPSPAATASLAIGEFIAARALD